MIALPNALRACGAEAVGTGLLVLGALSAVAACEGAGSPVLDAVPSASARLAIIGALVATVVSLIAASPLGRISGAHLNPAVTLAFGAMGCVGAGEATGYVGAQLVGASAGGLAFRAAWGDVARSVGGGVTHPSVSVAGAIGLEAAMTAILVGTILACVASDRVVRFTPLAIWPVLAVLVWLGSPATGTSLNPARSAGPALAFGDLADLWLYVLGPAAGALAATAAVWKLAGVTHRERMGLRPSGVSGDVHPIDGAVVVVAGQDAGLAFAGGKGKSEDAASRNERQPATGERRLARH